MRVQFEMSSQVARDSTSSTKISLNIIYLNDYEWVQMGSDVKMESNHLLYRFFVEL